MVQPAPRLLALSLLTCLGACGSSTDCGPVDRDGDGVFVAPGPGWEARAVAEDASYADC